VGGADLAGLSTSVVRQNKGSKGDPSILGHGSENLPAPSLMDSGLRLDVPPASEW